MVISEKSEQAEFITVNCSNNQYSSFRPITFDLLLLYAILAITVNHLKWTPVMKTPNIVFRSLLSPSMAIFITITAYLFAKQYAQLDERDWFAMDNIRELLGKLIPIVIVYLLTTFLSVVVGDKAGIRIFLIDIFGKKFVTGVGYPFLMVIQLIILLPFLYRIAKFNPVFASALFLLLNLLYEMIPFSIVISNSVYISFFPRLSFSMFLGVILFLYANTIKKTVWPIISILLWIYFQFLTEVGYQFHILIRWKHNSSIFTAIYAFGVICCFFYFEPVLRNKIRVKKQKIISEFGQAFIHIYFVQFYFITLLYPSVQIFLLRFFRAKLPIAVIFIFECLIATTFSASVGYIWYKIERSIASKFML